MHRDDVQRALDALAAEAPAPTGDAQHTIARGRRRTRQRRVALAGVIASLAAIVVIAGAIATNGSHGTSRVESVPTTRRAVEVVPQTTTATTPSRAESQPGSIPLAFAAPADGWMCGASTFTHTSSGFDPYRNGTSGVALPARTADDSGDLGQPPLCTAAPGGNAWLVRASADPSTPEVLHVRSSGRAVSRHSFATIAHQVVTDIAFADADRGWALVASDGSGNRDLYGTRDGGATWNVLAPGVPIFGSLHFTDAQHGWAQGTPGPLVRTSDGGRTWQSVDAPVLPALGLGTSAAPILASGNTVVARGERGTGMMVQPFFDVSTDGGNSWKLSTFSPDVQVPGTLPHPMVAADADHFALAFGDRLYASDDGGDNWALRSQFAGLAQIDYLAYLTPDTIVVSGVADPGNGATAVLTSTDAGESWSNVGGWAPPLAPDATVINFPGGIIGCPTHPLAAAPPGNPPAGLIDAAVQNIETVRGWTPVGNRVAYRVGEKKGEFWEVFSFQLPSCGQRTVAASWVVELSAAPGSGAGGSTPQAQIVLANSPDGWHVYGRYH